MTAQNFTVDTGITITGTDGNINLPSGNPAIQTPDQTGTINLKVQGGATERSVLELGSDGGADQFIYMSTQGNTGNAATIAMGAYSGESPYTTIRSYDGTSVTNNWTFTHAALDPTEAFLYTPPGAAISTPDATGGEGGKNIFIQAGASDPVTWNSNPGGELMLKGGYGSFGDGGGGPGGNVNINGGESSDSHAGNVNISSGLNTWSFDYTGKLTAPGDITTTGNISAHDASIGGNINGSGNFDIDGNANIGGNLFVTGNINFSGNVTQISGNSGVFYGNTATGVGALYAGKTGFTPVANTILQVTGDLDDYIQVNLQNTNHGNTASMELAITADDGDDVNNYLDMGIASSTWDGTQTNSLGTAVNPRDGYLYVQGGATGGNLILGTTTAGYSIKFNAGGPGSANTVATISATGISTTGNVTATNIGNVAALNLNGNASTILYGNGVFAAVPGANYGDSNVVTLLSSFGSNTVSTTGNITAGNIGVGRVTATANISTTGYFISGNQATGGFQLGNVNSRIQVGGGNSYMTFGQNPSIYPDTSASVNAGLLIGGNGYLLAPNGARALALGNDSNVAVTGSLNLPNGGQVVTTGNASFGNINTSASITRSGNFAQPAWTTSGIGLKMPTATYTDTTTAAGNLATTYVHTMAAPILGFSNAVNVANASTLFVSAPTAGTNATLGNAWAIMANGSITTTANVVPDGNIFFTGISASIRSLPGFAGAGSSGTWGVFDHNVPTGGFKVVNVGTGQLISTSTTTINIGTQFGNSNTTVYGNFVTANSASLGNTSTVTTANYAIGYRDIPQIAFSANANAALSDAGKHYYSTTAGNLALTLPNNTTTAFPVGTAMTVVVQAAGNVLVNAGTGVSLYLGGSSTAGNRVVGPYGMATLMKVAANVWFINGTGVY